MRNCISGRLNKFLKDVVHKRESPDSSQGLFHTKDQILDHHLDFPAHVHIVMRGDRPGTDPLYPSSMPWSLPLGICLHQRMPPFHMNWLCSPNLTRLKLIQNIWKFWFGKNLNNPLIWMNPVSGALVFTSSLQNNSTLVLYTGIPGKIPFAESTAA